MKGTILIIEDNRENLYLASFLLQRNGFAVRKATTGEAGILDARSSVPDLILVDIQLPDMDGFQVAEQLRKEEALTGIPMVAVSSFAMPGDREKALHRGFTGYIEKPINYKTFVEEVSQFLRESDGGKEI